MQKILLLITLCVFTTLVYAQDLVKLDISVKPSYQIGENLQFSVITQGNDLSRDTLADLWLVVIAEAFPNQWFYLNDNPAQKVSTVPQAYKRAISLNTPQQITWQSSLIDNNISGYYTLYALYTTPNASYNTLLSQALSNLAVKTLTITSNTGLESIVSNDCVSLMNQYLLPQQLSASGCVNPKDPRQFVSGLIPYAVNSPLWSDRADKSRAIALPEQTQITVQADGKWVLPVGTVLIKHFELAGKMIETRVLILKNYGDWVGYSYEWDDSGADAVLLTTNKEKIINDQHWQYPSSEQCLACHTKIAGGVLGLENLQMNRLFSYPQNQGQPRLASQLNTLSYLGVLTAQTDPKVMPDYRDTQASLEQRARAYLHANCSYCHRSDNLKGVPHDYRYDATLGKDICLEFDANNVRNFVIVPKHPELSLLITRMKLRNSRFMMPPLGSTLPDVDGIQLIEDWIKTMQTCPKL